MDMGTYEKELWFLQSTVSLCHIHLSTHGDLPCSLAWVTFFEFLCTDNEFLHAGIGIEDVEDGNDQTEELTAGSKMW